MRYTPYSGRRGASVAVDLARVKAKFAEMEELVVREVARRVEETSSPARRDATGAQAGGAPPLFGWFPEAGQEQAVRAVPRRLDSPPVAVQRSSQDTTHSSTAARAPSVRSESTEVRAPSRSFWKWLVRLFRG